MFRVFLKVVRVISRYMIVELPDRSFRVVFVLINSGEYRMGKTCALFGHRERFNLGNTDLLKEKLTTTICELIEKENVTLFLVGGHGTFDEIASRITHNLKEKYPFIETWIVLAYGSQLHQCKWCIIYDQFHFPESIERCKKLYAIPARNQYMVNQADIILCYVDTYGGAFNAIHYAYKKHKKIINLADYNIEDWI